MITPLINKYVGVSFVCAALLLVSVFFKLDKSPELNSEASNTPVVKNKVTVEKTVSKQAIKDIFNTPDLTAEQAAIFHGNLPQSLADSPPPSALDVNAQGQLIINMKVKRLFEFYLSAMGEDTLAECILRIRHDLSEQLSGEPLQTALDLLEGFLQYQNHIGDIKNEFVARYDDQTYDLARVREMKSSVRQSRSLFFSEQASTAFYQKEDEYDDYMLKKVAIKTDRSLTAEQRQAQYALLDSDSPEWLSMQEHQASLVSRVQAQEKSLRENGADEEEIRQLRVKNYGEQAAENLSVLDEQRAQWSDRVTQYRMESESILLGTGYTQHEKEQLLFDIRQQHFSGSELVRISALDKIELDKK